MSEIIIRPLNLDKDLENGFRESLSALSPVQQGFGPISTADYIRSHARVMTYVAELEDKIVGTASLLIEHKLSRECRPVGHLEDVAVHPSFKSMGIGLALVEYVVARAKMFGCRKVILDCDSSLVEFYGKAGFSEFGVAMRMDL